MRCWSDSKHSEILFLFHSSSLCFFLSFSLSSFPPLFPFSLRPSFSFFLFLSTRGLGACHARVGEKKKEEKRQSFFLPAGIFEPRSRRRLNATPARRERRTWKTRRIRCKTIRVKMELFRRERKKKTKKRETIRCCSAYSLILNSQCRSPCCRVTRSTLKFKPRI